MGVVLLVVLVLAAGGWVYGLVRFAAAIPEHVADADTPTDAIVVLTGGTERLSTGLGLLAENKAARAFVSGVHESVDVGGLLKTVAAPAEDLSGRIETGHGALDTAGNAVETAAWMRANGLRSLRLVTASYHMPRSLLEFRFALPEATVLPHPVFPDHVKHQRWWLWPGTTALIIGEYHKFVLAWLHRRADLTTR
ncbi:MAG: YdcF family protein [Rhodospirillales bacterium]